MDLLAIGIPTRDQRKIGDALSLQIQRPNLTQAESIIEEMVYKLKQNREQEENGNTKAS